MASHLVFGIVLKDSIRVVAYSGFAAGPASNAERCEGMKDTDGLAVGCEDLQGGAREVRRFIQSSRHEERRWTYSATPIISGGDESIALDDTGLTIDDPREVAAMSR